jgi:hypothetical protein
MRNEGIAFSWYADCFCCQPVVEEAAGGGATAAARRKRLGGVAGLQQENTISCAEMQVLSLSCVNYVD